MELGPSRTLSQLGARVKLQSLAAVWNEEDSKSRVNESLLVQEMGFEFTMSAPLLKWRVVFRSATTMYPVIVTRVFKERRLLLPTR
jgi:hypothetical protein